MSPDAKKCFFDIFANLDFFRENHKRKKCQNAGNGKKQIRVIKTDSHISSRKSGNDPTPSYTFSQIFSFFLCF